MGMRGISRHSPSQIQGSGITAAAFFFVLSGMTRCMCFLLIIY